MRARAKYYVIYRHRTECPVAVMCRFFAVSRSGYYAFVHRLDKPEKDAALAELIGQQQERSFQTYGYRRMWLWKGNPYDNAMAENFFSIFKTECIYRHKPATFPEANEMIDRYIYFYSYERIRLKTGEASFKPYIFLPGLFFVLSAQAGTAHQDCRPLFC